MRDNCLRSWFSHVGSLVILAIISSSVRAEVYTYSIGNSLTVDSQIEAMTQMGAQRGTKIMADEHIRAGVSLDYIWNNPNDHLGSYFAGPYPQAFTNYTWNAITLEPFYS